MGRLIQLTGLDEPQRLPPLLGLVKEYSHANQLWAAGKEMLKEFREEDHPRAPAGDERGGEFIPKLRAAHAQEIERRGAFIEEDETLLSSTLGGPITGIATQTDTGMLETGIDPATGEVDHQWTGEPKAAALAGEYRRIHNAASEDYKAAFARAGARMWRDDDNHPLGPQHEQSLIRAIENTPDWLPEPVMPLTVLDRYPEVRGTPAHALLQSEVRAIHERARKQWAKVLARRGVKKSEFREEDHPRHPAGSPQGGEFAPAGNASGSDQPPGGPKYRSLHALVDAEGQEFQGTPVDGLKKIVGRHKRPRLCFENAALLAIENEDFDYYEGLADPGYDFAPGLQIHHAWVVDRRTGQVIDGTWQLQPGRSSIERMRYRGIKISRGNLTALLLARKKYAVLEYDYPEGRRLFREGTGWLDTWDGASE